MPSSNRRRLLESIKQKRRRIAAQQIGTAFDIAIRENQSRPELSEKTAQLAWKLSTKFNVRLGHFRLLFCRSCKSFIVPPIGSRYRLSKKKRKTLTITCLKCGRVYRKMF